MSLMDIVPDIVPYLTIPSCFFELIPRDKIFLIGHIIANNQLTQRKKNKLKTFLPAPEKKLSWNNKSQTSDKCFTIFPAGVGSLHE
jgi:hypothetical protein